jgi:Baseplate J-like protein
VIPAPRIDRRTAIDIEKQLHTLLAVYAPDWKGEPGDFGDALVRIFARYAEIVIERLNRTLDKNLLAYLDMLGEALLPPQPARVPLTFSLAAGSAADGVVPAATQVAAPPAADDPAPVIFETERELTVVAATLDKIFSGDPGVDSFTDLSPSALVSGERRAFRGTTPIDHSLHIGLDDLLGRNALSELRLDFEITPGTSTPHPWAVSWSIVDDARGTPIVPTRDGTAGLTRSGQLVFTFPTGLPVVLRQSVNRVQSRWLRGRLTTPITPSILAVTGPVQAAHLPTLQRLAVSADLDQKGLPVGRAFANAVPLDTTKDFFPFGERPRLGDALYLSAGDAFAVAEANVTLKVMLSAGNTPKKSATLKLKWEYWDGKQWADVGALNDCTVALTTGGEIITFQLGPHPAMHAVNNTDGYWVRVRLTAGDYGHDAGYSPVDADHLDKGYQYIAPTFAPPSIASVAVDYKLTLSEQRADHILTYNNFAYEVIPENTSFQPFRPNTDSDRTLYLGFALPSTRSAFPNRPVALYFDIAEPDPDAKPDEPSPTEPPRLVWECWEGEGGWRRPGLRDGTQGLTRPGVLEFLAPATFALRREFGLERYWLRCRWEAGSFAFEPRLQRALLNIVMARHATTILDETLGSSDGGQGQCYVTMRRPVLHGQEELRVREPDLPSADEHKAAGGDDAVTVTRDAGGRPIEIWVRWREVRDFYGSGPRDRHYVLDHVTGTVSFGDGVNGLVPPPGAGNLRFTRYRTGGGSAGNCAAGTIAQLKTTIPYVDKVTNHEPARGGADAETIDSLRERGPRAIRHRDRAVTIEDYEDLAMLASPEVARAKCVPLYDLSANPDAKGSPLPGKVSVIIVPRSTEAKPLPSRVLLERVAEHLDARRLPVVDLKIVRPHYLRVDVKAEIVLASIDRASEVQPRIIDALRSFLHPLTGGLDDTGWDFGREPQESDLLRSIGEIPGVDHVNSLTLTPKLDRDGGAKTWALVYAGSLDISVMAGR